jgi:multiple sugar transport system permease protein
MTLSKIDLRNNRRASFRKKLLGSREKNGVILNIVMYTLLISIGFVYLYPLFHMLAVSFMQPSDLLDSAVRWIPRAVHLENYRLAMITMDFWTTLFKNLQIALFPTVLQLFSTATAGYAFARYDFPLKRLWLAILIFTFVIPPQITMIPTFVLYDMLGVLGSINAFTLPAVLGQGFNSAIFILIFYNFHRQVPPSLIEAAEIDGAGHIASFFRISMPLALPAIIVTVLFSFVWYWNEVYLVNLFLGFGNSREDGLTTILLELTRFQQSYSGSVAAAGIAPDPLNEGMRMAGTMLAIAPLLVLYLMLQKQFVESVDKSGITGE